MNPLSDDPMPPNASEFTIHRWFEGASREPVFKVTWENSWAWEGDEDDEHEQDFPTLEAAFEFGRQLFATAIEINAEPLV